MKLQFLQANCRQNNAVSTAILNQAAESGIDIVCLQEPWIRKQSALHHSAFQIWWTENQNQQKNRTAIAVNRKTLARQDLSWNFRSDLIQHTHLQCMDVQDLNRPGYTLRILNIYNQYYEDQEGNRVRPINTCNIQQLITSSKIFLGDFNAKSPLWDPLGRKDHEKELEALIIQHDLTIENTPGEWTRIQGKERSIIDLTLTTVGIGQIENWTIATEWAVGSDHLPITFCLSLPNWALNQITTTTTTNLRTGWKFDSLTKKDQEDLTLKWHALSPQWPQDFSSKEGIEQSAQWIQTHLVEFLDQHVPQMRLSSYAKRWWNDTIKDARREYSRNIHLWHQQKISWETVRGSRNHLYTTIRKEKRLLWESFLAGHEEEADNQLKTVQRVWKVARYTKPQVTKATPAIKTPEGLATSRNEKEQIFMKQAFPAQIDTTSLDQMDTTKGTTMDTTMDTTHAISVTRDEVQKALYSQSTKKAPGVSLISFRAPRVLWQWDSAKIIALINASVSSGYQPKCWKTAKGILLPKPNKPDYSIPKAYRVISLLECLGKVVEKVVAERISNYCEQKDIFHKGQFGCRKQRGTQDALSQLVDFTQQAWKQKQLAGAIFLDVQGAFDKIHRSRLIQILIDIEIPINICL